MRERLETSYRIAGWSLVLWLAFFSLSPTAYAAGQVLCFGIDGHIAIERAAGLDCTDGAKPALVSHDPSFRHLSFSSPDQHCGGCRDVELVNSGQILPTKMASAAELRCPDLPAALVDNGHSLWPSVIALTSIGPILPSRSAVDPSLHERRTVVLLI